jgi:hypothetical protein
LLPIATVPLESTPGIPQFVDVCSIVFNYFEQGIGVIVDDALDAFSASGEYNEIIFRRIGDDIFHFIWLILEPGPVSGTASKIFHEEVGSHEFCCKIAADHLRPRLLYQQNPYFVADGLGKERLLRCCTAGEVIVHYYVVWLAVRVESQHVESQLQVVIRKNVHYLLGCPGVFRNSGEAIANSQLSLLDVVGINAVEQFKFRA